MYQDNFFENAHQITTNDEVSIPSIEKHEEACDVKIGLVTDCKKLNVREEPRADAAIVCEITYQTELMIDEKESTEGFYKVCTAAGIEGFCMKKFIAVQP